MEVSEFANKIEIDGWVAIPNLLSLGQVKNLCVAMENSYAVCREIQTKNKLPLTDGTVHHLLGQDSVYLDFFENNLLLDFIDSFFGSKSIINSYGGVINLPSKNSYVHDVHRDIRSFSEEYVMLNMLIMLDDFTLENGAT